MAEVRLHGSEVFEGDLPRVCILCGERSTVYRKKKYQWHPSWVYVLLLLGLLPFALVALILTKRMTISAPLCHEHRNHWAWRAWVTWLGVIFFAVLGIAAIIAVNQGPPGQPNPAAGLICVLPGFLAFAFLIVLAVLQHTSVRATQITDRDITLTNVADEFIDALEAEAEIQERERRRPSRRRDIDDDDEDDDVRARDERIAKPRRRERDDEKDDDDDHDDRIRERPRRT